MEISDLYTGVMEAIGPMLVLSGFISLTISCIIMLVNILINAFTGKGMKL